MDLSNGVYGYYAYQVVTRPTTSIKGLKGTEGQYRELRIPVRIFAEEHEAAPPCTALIDTGADVCLIRHGMIPSNLFYPASRPLRLVGVNGKKLEGGDKEVKLN